jgi:anti-anti-sigma factor
MSFNLNIRNVNAAIVVDVDGRFTIGNPVDTFQRVMNEQYEGGQRHFVVNMAGASFVDSSGIGALIRVWTTLRRLREKSGSGAMVLLNVTPRMRDLLIITQLSTTLLTFDDEAAAVAAALA